MARLRDQQLANFKSNFEKVDLRYAKRKNLTALRRADHRVAGRARGDGGQGAADHRLGDLQPAPRRHPARHRRDHAVRGRQLEAAAAGSPSSRTRARTTRACTRACRPVRSATRASPRSRRRPTRPRPDYPVLRGQAGHAAASTTSPKTDAEFQGYVNEYNRARDENGGKSPTHLLSALAGVLGFPVGHSRSPAMMNAAFRGARARLALRDAAGAARAVRRDREGAAGVGLPRGQRDDPAQAAPRTTWPTSSATPPRAIGAVNTLTFERGRAHRGRQHRRRRSPRRARASLRRHGARARGGRRRARRGVGARAGPGVEVTVWNRTPERAAELAAELGVSASERPGRAELLVNATSVGLRPADSLDGPAAGRRERGRRPRLRNALRRRSPAGPRSAERASSTASRCSSVRAPEAFSVWTGEEPPLDVMRRAVVQSVV